MQRTWVLRRRREPSKKRRILGLCSSRVGCGAGHVRPHSALRYRILNEFEREFLGLTKAS